MNRSLFFIIFLFVIAIWVSACHKKGNAIPALAKYTGCRVMQIIEPDLDTGSRITYRFTYNDDGTVATVSVRPQPLGDSFLKKITYKTNCIIVFTADNSSPYSKDSLVIDGQNRVTYIDHYSYNGSPSPNEVFDEYLYDANGYLENIVYHNYSSISSQTFHWANDDLGWNTSGNDFYTYVYDTGVYNIGNITARTSDLENYGRSIYTPRHLISQAIMDNTDTITCTYTVDTGGSITTLNKQENGYPYTKTTRITYACE